MSTLISVQMYSRTSLQLARETRTREELRAVAEQLVATYVLPAAEQGETRFILTPALLSQVLRSMRKTQVRDPLVTPTITDLQELVSALLPGVDVYVVTQIAHPDAFTTTRLDTLTIDWS